MKLTSEEFATVAAFEKHLQTAVRSNYLRNVGRSGLAALVPIYQRVTGSRERVDGNCGACILGFLKRLGAIYFADKAEQEQQAAAPDAADDIEAAQEQSLRRRGRRPKSEE